MCEIYSQLTIKTSLRIIKLKSKVMLWMVRQKISSVFNYILYLEKYMFLEFSKIEEPYLKQERLHLNKQLLTWNGKSYRWKKAWWSEVRSLLKVELKPSLTAYCPKYNISRERSEILMLSKGDSNSPAVVDLIKTCGLFNSDLCRQWLYQRISSSNG